MAKWINKKGWLDGYVKPARDAEEDVKSKSSVVVHSPLKCPGCRSRSVRCYGADKPILYYKCVDCDLKFKVLEKDDV
jgi:transposase-like protein